MVKTTNQYIYILCRRCFGMVWVRLKFECHWGNVFESNFIHFILGSLGSDINLEVGKHAGKARGKKQHEFEPWQHGTMLNLG